MTFLIFAMIGITIIALGVFFLQILIGFSDLFVLCSAKGISFRGTLTLWFIANRNKKRNLWNELSVGIILSTGIGQRDGWHRGAIKCAMRALTAPGCPA